MREIDKLITEKHVCHVENLAIAANVRMELFFFTSCDRLNVPGMAAVVKRYRYDYKRLIIDQALCANFWLYLDYV